MSLIDAYPSFITLYQEIARFRTNPEEVTHMFSEALLEMDRNLERYMVEEAQKHAEEVQKKYDDKCAENERLKAILAEHNIPYENVSSS